MTSTWSAQFHRKRPTPRPERYPTTPPTQETRPVAKEEGKDVVDGRTHPRRPRSRWGPRGGRVELDCDRRVDPREPYPSTGTWTGRPRYTRLAQRSERRLRHPHGRLGTGHGSSGACRRVRWTGPGRHRGSYRRNRRLAEEGTVLDTTPSPLPHPRGGSRSRLRTAGPETPSRTDPSSPSPPATKRVTRHSGRPVRPPVVVPGLGCLRLEPDTPTHDSRDPRRPGVVPEKREPGGQTRGLGEPVGVDGVGSPGTDSVGGAGEGTSQGSLRLKNGVSDSTFHSTYSTCTHSTPAPRHAVLATGSPPGPHRQPPSSLAPRGPKQCRSGAQGLGFRGPAPLRPPPPPSVGDPGRHG